jgi:hypothetical protein
VDSVIIEDVMDQIGQRLNTIQGFHVLPYEADSIEKVPAAMISLPTEINYRNTYQNGMTTIDIGVVVLVSIVDDRVRRDQVAPYGDNQSKTSIRKILETGTYTAFDVISVNEAIFDVLIINDIKYLAIVFRIAIAGS